MAETVRILRHGNCFDGFASAATFMRFYRDCVDSDARFRHRGLSHGRPEPIDGRLFDGDVNAIVDFRYSPHTRLDWWFDHHKSAFLDDDERAHFDQSANPRHYWDPTAPSCTGYIARVCAEQHGFDTSALEDLVAWAEMIDAAQFPNAKMAVELSAPPLQLMSVCEHLRDGRLANDVLNGLAEGDLDGVAGHREIQKRFRPILARHERTLGLMRELAVLEDDVIFIDLIGQRDIVGNKFGPYYLYPSSTYVVVIIAWKDRVKLSVGSNPWRPDARRHDISEICKRYGGGGHPVVGGITIPNGTIEDGRRIAREIVATLRQPQ